MKIVIRACALLCALVSLRSLATPLYQETKVFDYQEQGYAGFLSAGLFITSSDVILAVTDARYPNPTDSAYKDLVYKRSTDHGATWSSFTNLENGKSVSSGERWSHPVTVEDVPSGNLFLLYCLKHVDGSLVTTDTEMYFRKSTDGGQTWSAKTDITADLRSSDPETRDAYFAYGNGIQLSATHPTHPYRLVIPLIAFNYGESSFGNAIAYSDDAGVTWALKSVPLSSYKGHENRVVELQNGVLMMNSRSQNSSYAERRLVSFSTDGGDTWSAQVLSDELPDFNKVDIGLGFASRGWASSRLVFAHPATYNTSVPNYRTDLTIRLSYDEGQSWPIARQIYGGDTAYTNVGRFTDDTLGVFWGKESLPGLEKVMSKYLYFSRLNVEWISGGVDSGGGTIGVPDIIVDDSSAGFTSSGWPTKSSTPGYYGTGYKHDGSSGSDPSAWAKWTPTISTAGEYFVYITWPGSGASRPTAVPVEISHAAGTTNLTLDQTSPLYAGRWKLMGRYQFAAGTSGYVKITGASPGYTMADAVRFVKYEVKIPACIRDNADSNGYSDSGGWVTSTSSGAGTFEGKNYRHDNTAGADLPVGSRFAEWQFNAPITADYDVYIRWPQGANRPSAVPYAIEYNNGASIVTGTLNQQSGGSTWVFIGNFRLEARSTDRITIVCDGSGYTVADAVKIERP